jgi:hypothetical protein
MKPSLLAGYLAATLKVEDETKNLHILSSTSVSSTCFCISSTSTSTSSCSLSFPSSPTSNSSNGPFLKEKKEEKKECREKDEKKIRETSSNTRRRSQSSEKRKEKSKEEKTTFVKTYAEIAAKPAHAPASSSDEKSKKTATPLFDKYLTEKGLKEAFTANKSTSNFISAANSTTSITKITRNQNNKQNEANDGEATKSSVDNENKRKIAECSFHNIRFTSRNSNGRLSYSETQSSFLKNTPTSSPQLKRPHYGHHSRSREKSKNENFENSEKKEPKKSNEEKVEDKSKKYEPRQSQDSNEDYEKLVKFRLTKFFEMKSSEWKNYSKNLVDTHCHFDMLFSRYAHIIVIF